MCLCLPFPSWMHWSLIHLGQALGHFRKGNAGTVHGLCVLKPQGVSLSVHESWWLTDSQTCNLLHCCLSPANARMAHLTNGENKTSNTQAENRSLPTSKEQGPRIFTKPNYSSGWDTLPLKNHKSHQAPPFSLGGITDPLRTFAVGKSVSQGRGT